MEEIIINIDSKYRDIELYPSESKFKINFDKTYKNIISAKLSSIEINNHIDHINSKKGNNWIKIHLPNKLNDPEGTIIEINNGLIQLINSIQKIFNTNFNNIFNSNQKLETPFINNLPFAEKYFYFFYLNQQIQLIFDFNNTFDPITLGIPLIINEGWYSVYGITKIIQNYIINKYNERIKYKQLNPLTPVINLDQGNFIITLFTLNIFDRRFRSIDITNEPTINDCVRVDTFTPSGAYELNNLQDNLDTFKNDFYKLYIYDTITFSTQLNTTSIPVNSMGILDQLVTNNYTIPLNYNYLSEGTLLLSESKYYTNNSLSVPTTESIQIYNLQNNINIPTLTVSFSNTFNTQIDFCYYYVDPLNISASSWNNNGTKTSINKMNNLLSKNFQKDNHFITTSQYNDKSYNITMNKDIAPFDIDFNTITNISTNIGISKLNYPSIGHYLGYRPNLKKSLDNFLYSSILYELSSTIIGTKIYNSMGDEYIFLKLNNWGYYDFFNKIMFAKILIPIHSNTFRSDDYININKEVHFRQPTNFQQLDIELIDYLGNRVDLNGFDFSFTLELKQIVNSDQKNIFEKKNLIFHS
jgi:hypothetical protein